MRFLLKIIAVSLLAACSANSSAKDFDVRVKGLILYSEYDKKTPGLRELENAHGDAKNVEKAMRKLPGSRVENLNDLAESDWDRAIKEYLEKPPTAKYIIVYVGGHGAQRGGHIVFKDSLGRPVDAEKQFARIMAIGAEATIFFVNACRTAEEPDPLQPSAMGLRGKNAVILFSTDANNEVNDGMRDAGSVFANAVAEQLPKEQELRVTLRHIIDHVSPGAGGSSVLDQNPWPYGLITSDVHLALHVGFPGGS